MSMLIPDKNVVSQIKETRRLQGLDKHDEVWEGKTVIMPLPNDNHRAIANGFSKLMLILFGWNKPHFVRPGVNISDRAFGWTDNYRCPDFVVYFQGNSAVNYETYWHSGPDFLVEIVSEDDRSREKLPFYASVNTHEVLIIDRDPRVLELYRLQNGQMVKAGESSLSRPDALPSGVLPASFRLVSGTNRPGIEVTQTGTGQSWVI